MCGDLEGQHELESFADFIDQAIDRVAKATVPTDARWAQILATLPDDKANQELLAQVLKMAQAVMQHRPESLQPEGIAQMAQVFARASGLLAGLLVDDGSLQRIALSQLLAGVDQGRTLEHDLTTPSHDHSHDHDHDHDHPHHH